MLMGSIQGDRLHGIDGMVQHSGRSLGTILVPEVDVPLIPQSIDRTYSASCFACPNFSPIFSFHISCSMTESLLT